jgi:hypothetical protein
MAEGESVQYWMVSANGDIWCQHTRIGRKFSSWWVFVVIVTAILRIFDKFHALSNTALSLSWATSSTM